MPDLIDIGANLAHDSFDADRDAVLERARRAGVRRIVVTGSSDESNVAAADLAEASPGHLFATAGVHPHHAADYTDASDELIRVLTERPGVVAVGECGLDYFRDFSPRPAQRDAFRAQLDIAADTGMPVFLHQRDAHEDFVTVLEPVLRKIPRGVAHCFTGGQQALTDYLALGLFIGITGWICDERRGRELYELVAGIPDDRLMLETDAPYLLPRTLEPRPQSRRNEPAYLAEVLRVVAEARGQTPAHVAAVTTRNAELFFGLGAG
ncbi:MAG: TatD family hydrolase [Woeseiaceae bacterium]|nr:TatD family hydrolase [Woeseiaceae bacterium]